MKKIKKGQFGYIAYQKKWTLIRTLIYFAICAAVFIIGYVTTGSRKNLLTVVAILGCLPACKSAVNVIMFFRARGCSQSAHEKIAEKEEGLCGLYDLYMTSYKNNYPISHIVISGTSLIGLTEDPKADTNAAEEHIKDHLKQDGIKNMMVKIFDNTEKYTDRLEGLKELDNEPLKNQKEILEMLLAISL